MALTDELEKDLKSRTVDPRDLVKTMRAAFPLVMYGETHVGVEKKAEFFARLIREQGDRFHASEYFINEVALGAVVEDYLEGRKTKSSLPSGIRLMAPILDAVKERLATTGIVFSGSRFEGSTRDRMIFQNFKSSRALHLQSKRFAEADPGHFHIGAAHAGRLPLAGGIPTTTQLLIKDGFKPGVVRLVVDVGGSSIDSGTTVTVRATEGFHVLPVGGGDDFDLMDVIRKVSGGDSFGADIRSSGVFSKIRPLETTSSDGFHKYFDAILFLK